MHPQPPFGKVYLVGAGPGDPGLITLRGKYLLEHAEVVVYDYLASPKLLNYVPKTAEFIYAGKKGGGLHAFTQKDINKLLVEHAKPLSSTWGSKPCRASPKN